MKKVVFMLAAVAMLFVGCSKDDDKNDNNGNDLKVAEKIIGKWIVADIDGKTAPTNKKMVFTFDSATKAYMTASLNWSSVIAPRWLKKEEYAVAINGTAVTLTTQRDERTTVTHEFTVKAINDNEFTTNDKFTKKVGGNVEATQNEVIRFTKVATDYAQAIVGLWEGHVTSEGSVHDDGQVHRWEYKADGNYVYYEKNGDQWVPSANTLNEYFVDGNLLCTRWINEGVEYREWWEIASIKDGVMKWTGLREKEDGSTFIATFEMTKVTE